jgi:hypothetical protein
MWTMMPASKEPRPDWSEVAGAALAMVVAAVALVCLVMFG